MRFQRKLVNDILVSDNGFGKLTYEKIKNNDLIYLTLDELEDMQEQRYRFFHFCVHFDDKFFYRLRQCIDMADKIQAIILHQPAEYESMIDFQRTINVPIIYIPHSVNDDIWHWSMIGVFSDNLIDQFRKIFNNTKINEKPHKLLGL